LIERKQPLDPITAIASLGEDGKRFVLAYIGAGPLEPRVRAAAKQHGVRAHVLGFRNQSELPALYAAADLLVLPSREPSETWGLVVNEAFACGLPAVVSDAAGCAPDLITEGQSGSVYPRGDCAALGRALRLHADLRARPETQARLADLSDTHSPENAAHLMLSAIQHTSAHRRRA